ncbi:MAG: TIGR03663 family protein [Oligoflexia bacterium]|nr:TIGR03663 family protein [Oligoflexia bacterium]
MVSEETHKKKQDWALWTILAIAVLLRFLFLAIKPPHFDEGINGWFVDQLIAHGFYKYDPTNYHGPFHFYVMYVFKLLMGRNLWALRISASLFGVAAVYLMILLRPYIGRFTANSAALFMAVSPGMVFYSRYAIHESELLFFSLLALLGFLRNQTKNDRTSLWQIALGCTGMILTKETFIVHIGTFFIAWGCLKIYERFSPSTDMTHKPQPSYHVHDIWIVTFVSAFLIVIFYTGFFRNPQGVNDLFHSFMPWYKTGAKGNGHDKPLWYWVTLFTRYEWMALVGLLYLPRFLFKSSRWLRLISIYGFGCFLAYSIINYKTPWCIIEIIWPFLILAASLLSDFARHTKRALHIALVAVITFSMLSTARSIELNFFKYADATEPYVYVQTYPDIMNILAKLDAVVTKSPKHRDSRIVLLLDSDWPLPWLLGDYTKAEYYGTKLPNNADGILILVDGNRRLLFEQKITKEYFAQPFMLRNSKGECYAYFDTEVFKDFFDEKTMRVKPQAQIKPKPGQGLVASYYSTADWSGAVVATKTVGNIDFSWSNNQRTMPAPFGIIFTGEIFIPKNLSVEFFLTSDDGSDLWIDDVNVISNLGAHPTKTVSKTVFLKQGWRKLQLRYNDYGGEMMGQLRWRNSSDQEEIVPVSSFRIKSVTK